MPGSSRLEPTVLAVGVATALVVLLGALLVPATAARTKVLDRAERRFNHAAHTQMVENKLGKDIACGDACHTMSEDMSDWRRAFDDKKEHERCYVSCHGGFSHTMTTSRRALKGLDGRTCFPCHGKRLKYRPKDSNLGKVAGATQAEHVALYSHRAHVTPKASSGKQCEACHGKFGDDRGQDKGTLAAGHENCSGCHGKAVEPKMNDCKGCHVRQASLGDRAPVARPRTASPYAVTGGFSHKEHARQKRVGTEGRTCLACHANIAEAKAVDVIPMPTMKGCYEGCHDGKKAFSVTGTRCTECHQRGAP